MDKYKWISFEDGDYFGYIEEPVDGNRKFIGVEGEDEDCFKEIILSEINKDLLLEIDISGPVVVKQKAMTDKDKRAYKRIVDIFEEAKEKALYRATRDLMKNMLKGKD